MSIPRLINFDKYLDKRGFFADIITKKISSSLKLKGNFSNYQISLSSNNKNVIRGLHYQKPMQAKLVFVIKGKIQDIVLDIDKNSKTFGRFYQFILKEKDKL